MANSVVLILIVALGLLAAIILLRHKQHLSIKCFGFHLYAGEKPPEEPKPKPKRKQKRGGQSR